MGFKKLKWKPHWGFHNGFFKVLAVILKKVLLLKHMDVPQPPPHSLHLPCPTLRPNPTAVLHPPPSQQMVGCLPVKGIGSAGVCLVFVS